MILPFSEKARQLAHSSDLAIGRGSISEAKGFIEGVALRQVNELGFTNDVAEVKKLAICKAILSLCPYPVIVRFANNYAKLWQRFFRDNPAKQMEFAAEAFPSLTTEGGVFKIGVFDFLAAEESISLMHLQNGKVLLSKQELTTVIYGQVKRLVMTVPKSAVLPEDIKEVAASLAKQFAPLVPKGAKHLEKEEVKKIRQGVGEGGRYYACMKLSRACFNDGLSLDEAKQIILEYVKACPQGRNPFTEKEALTCLEWVYRKGDQTWRLNAR